MISKLIDALLWAAVFVCPGSEVQIPPTLQKTYQRSRATTTTFPSKATPFSSAESSTSTSPRPYPTTSAGLGYYDVGDEDPLIQYFNRIVFFLDHNCAVVAVRYAIALGLTVFAYFVLWPYMKLFQVILWAIKMWFYVSTLPIFATLSFFVRLFLNLDGSSTKPQVPLRKETTPYRIGEARSPAALLASSPAQMAEATDNTDTVVLGDLSLNNIASSIRDALGTCGTVTIVRLPTSLNNKTAAGIGFVRMNETSYPKQSGGRSSPIRSPPRPTVFINNNNAGSYIISDISTSAGMAPQDPSPLVLEGEELMPISPAITATNHKVDLGANGNTLGSPGTSLLKKSPHNGTTYMNRRARKLPLEQETILSLNRRIRDLEEELKQYEKRSRTDANC